MPDFRTTNSESVIDIIKKIEDQILHMGWKRSEDNHLKFDANKDGAKVRDWIDATLTDFAARLPPEDRDAMLAKVNELPTLDDLP